MVNEFKIHMTIHTVGVALAAVLTFVACNAFMRNRTPKTLLLAIAFVLLEAEQLMEFSQSLGVSAVNITLPYLGIELIHAVSVGAIAFLTAGVLKKA
jgi:hypothetical protein